MSAREFISRLLYQKSELKEARLVESKGDQVSANFRPGEDYFVAHVNEMFLGNEREWFRTYDPIVLVLSEHVYGGQDVTVPFVVGPELIKKHISETPEGMVLSDTRVAGIHPYNGGSFALTVVLAKVVQDDYTKRLLTFIERTSSAFTSVVGGDSVINLGGHLKVAEALLTGVEGLFGLKQTTPIVGQRMSYDHGLTPWLRSGFYAMLDQDVEVVDWSGMSVSEGRLNYSKDGKMKRYRDSDFVLFSIAAQEKRPDWRNLQFYKDFEGVLRTVLSGEEKAWEKAKAQFLVLYGSLLTSPDLTWPQAQEIYEVLKARLSEVKSIKQGTENLSEGSKRISQSLESSSTFQLERAKAWETAGSLLDL